MLKGLVAFGLIRRPIVLLGLAVFVAAGLIAFTRLNIEAYPNPAPVILEITAQAAGLSAEEMERYYTIPMEIGLFPTPGIDNIRSTSFYGLSFVRVTFRYGVDYFFAYTQAALSLTQNVTLPGNQVPSISQSSLVGEIYRYQVVGPPHFGLTNLRTVQDWIAARGLFTVTNGVVQVNSWGGTTKQYNVDVDLHKLDAYNVTIPQIIGALGNANVNVGGREITVGQQSVNIRGIGLFDSGGNEDLTQGYHVNDIENVVLGQFNGVPVQVKDVAKVSVGYVPRLGIAGIDHDSDAALSIVVMGRNFHTNDVIPRVKAEIEKLNTDGELPPGVKLVPYYDRSTLVGVTTHTVLHNLIFGCLLVFIIQWMFLGNLRSAIIVGVNIPFALFFAVIIMVMLGEDANLLSVGAVDFGIIVDSAVILIENVFRNFQHPGDRQSLLQQLAEGRFGEDPTRVAGTTSGPMWTDRLRLILGSALQIDMAILFSAIITVAAFVPLFTMQGVEGQIFSPMARTYGLALFGALLSTFTITPVLASVLLPEHVEESETIVVRALRGIYIPILSWSLVHRKVMVVAAAVFMAIVVLLGSRLGSEFLPALEEGNLWIRAALPPTMGLEASEPAAAKMREILLRHPEVLHAVSQHGRPDNGTDASPFSNVELFVPLKPFDEWPRGYLKDDLINDLQKEFNDELPGVVFNFSQYIQDNVEEALSGVKGANSVKILGHDQNILESLATQVEHQMTLVRGIADLGIFHVQGQPNLNVKVNREKAARYGLNTGDVTTVIQAALGGAVATTLLEGDRSWNVQVRLPPEYRASLEAVGSIKVGYTNAAGTNSYIPLRELADISLDTGASYIYHESRERYIPIKFSVRDRDLAGAVAEAQDRIAKNVTLPVGYRITWAGEFEDLQNAQARLAVIVPISLLMIVVLLYGLFNSLRDSLLVLTGIPFAVGGGIIALYFSGLHFSISAAVGFISLFGVSVMNGILIMTYYNEVKLAGATTMEAMFHAASQRMRPMLMTALSACIGLLPAAVSTGIGSQVQRPLATVVVGGMFIGPIVLLIVVPALQTLILERADRATPAGEPDAPPQPAE
ncbi:MAG: CusA/CzcA family heavy metal efflux RND transporter [Xanthobacteraceae bacterium]|jgi:cobalt-zinc-cadmium resistance protein CzcA